jgi:hypothetical protein
MTAYRPVTNTEQLSDLPAETKILLRGQCHTVGEFADLYLPGHYPFLMGLAQLGVPIEVEVTVAETWAGVEQT